MFWAIVCGAAAVLVSGGLAGAYLAAALRGVGPSRPGRAPASPAYGFAMGVLVTATGLGAVIIPLALLHAARRACLRARGSAAPAVDDAWPLTVGSVPMPPADDEELPRAA